jgi:protein TonB
MIQKTPAQGQNTYSLTLVAIALSVFLHLGTWLSWQTVPDTLPPMVKPAQLIEVELTSAPTAKAEPVIIAKQEPETKPAKPQPPAIVTKPKPKPITPTPTPKPKPALKPNPLPIPTLPDVARVTPPVASTTEKAVRLEPTPTKAETTTPPAVTESLVKADYKSPSLNNPPTHYPRIAQTRQWEGTVILEIRVLANGEAGEVKIVQSSGHEILDESAVEQVKAWRFIPAHKGDKSVDDWVRVPITFKFKH